MPRRKKHSRLPNGYGSIRYLGKNRKNPYAVHPPANIDGDRPAALCYVDAVSYTHLSKNIGQTFGDIWYLVFGSISQAADKKLSLIHICSAMLPHHA